MKIKSILFFVAFCTLLQSNAQTKEIWGGIITNTQFKKNWGWWNDSHFLSNSFFIYRTGLSYTFHPKINITGGYARVVTATSFSDKLIRREHRLWGQSVYRNVLSERWMLRGRLRYDARYRQKIENNEVLDQKILYYRIRFFLSARYRFKERNSGAHYHLNVTNETLFNYGKQVENALDQNRTYLMMGYTKGKTTLLLGSHLRLIPSQNSLRYHYGITFWWIQGFEWALGG